MTPMRIGVVGAGPAGIMAALEAASLDADVMLFDTNDQVGRKLLVTGNGRCNISNLSASPENYSCSDPNFVRQVLVACGPEALRTRLWSLGIPTYATPDGWCYPLSDSAATVADALSAELDMAGVHKRLKTRIDAVEPRGKGFYLPAGGGSHGYQVDRVIVASGGKAYPALGSKGTLFPELARLGHHLSPIYPALAPIVAEVKQFHLLQGVRLDVAVELYEGQRRIGATTGNLMFTQFGFSGPAAMDISHLVGTRPDAELTLRIDLLWQREEALRAVLDAKRRQPIPLRVVLGSVLPAKLPPVMLAMAGIEADARLDRTNDESLGELLGLLRRLEARVTGTRGFRFAQLSSGGVPVTEVDAATMASRIVRGLYLAGEVLDVVGPCGGYNLHWAFASGAIAGRSAAGIK